MTRNTIQFCTAVFIVAVFFAAILLILLFLFGLYSLSSPENPYNSLIAATVLLLLLATSNVFYRIAANGRGGSNQAFPLKPDDENWDEHDAEALQKLRAFCLEIESDKIRLSSFEDFSAQAHTLIELIASHYHPHSKTPELEVEVAEALAALEAACRDLRLFTEKNIPFHDILSINEMRRAKKTFDLGRSLLLLYQGATAVHNPPGRLWRELTAFLPGKLLSETTSSSILYLISSMFEILGKNCIRLYRGNLGRKERGKNASIEKIQEELTAFSESQALRVLVLGQTSSGKSSLINAVFDKEELQTGHIPRNNTRKEVRRSIRGLGELHVIEAPGYQEAGTEKLAFDAVVDLIPLADLILLVIPALSAARRADILLLKRIEAACRVEKRSVPAFICVSKVDALRPFEDWSPPYNINSPESHQDAGQKKKAQNIRAVIDTISSEADLPPELVVPVCMREEAEPYNIDVLCALIQTVLPQAKTAMLRRLFTRFLEDQELRDFELALVRTGTLVLKQGVRSVLKAAARLSPR